MDDATSRPRPVVPESREVIAHRERCETPAREPVSGLVVTAIIAIVLVLAIVGWAVVGGAGI